MGFHTPRTFICKTAPRGNLGNVMVKVVTLVVDACISPATEMLIAHNCGMGAAVLFGGLYRS